MPIVLTGTLYGPFVGAICGVVEDLLGIIINSQGTVHFGFDDPYTSGQVLTWISPFYGLYGRHVQVIPDFLEPCLEGELKLKGRIRLGTLLFLVFRMLQNKQIRLWVRKWRES